MANYQRNHFFFILLLTSLPHCLARTPATSYSKKLRFSGNGEFKILQVADMHYANGPTTKCLDVLPSQIGSCSDLNTTLFLSRLIAIEKPHLIAFTGDNIFAYDTEDPAKSMNAAFAPAILSKTPWVAILGNHDQESTMSRQQLMKHIVKLPYTLSQTNPPDASHYIDGSGNCNLQVGGVAGSSFQNKSVMNLYFLDSGAYSPVPSFHGYDWIKPSQQFWFERTSKRLEREFKKAPNPQAGAAPGLGFFHIPLPEFGIFKSSNGTTGVRQEAISSSTTNSGFFTTLVARGDVKAVFVGHDHLNDFCTTSAGLNLCYGGGFGYHAYGKAGWDRRARIVVAKLEQTGNGSWGDVKSIETWKRLDDRQLSVIDRQVLWSKGINDL